MASCKTNSSLYFLTLRFMIYNAEKGVMKSNIRQLGRGFFLKRAFNHRGYVALFIATYRGHASIVSKLMALGINACRKMPSGRSAIQVAIFKERINCVNALVGKLRHPIVNSKNSLW